MGGGLDEGRGARVSDFFLQRIQMKKKFVCVCVGGGWGGGSSK